jgi:hypothetical protein
LLADLGTGSRVPLDGKALPDKEQIKKRLRLDFERILTRSGRRDLSVRCIDQGNALIFWYEAKRAQTPKANKDANKA